MSNIGIARTKISGPQTRNIITLKRDHTSPTVGYDPDDFLVSEYYKITEGMNTPRYHQRLSKGELLPYTWFRQMEISGEHAIKLLQWTRTSPAGWAIREPGNSTSKALAEIYWRVKVSDLDKVLDFEPARYHLQRAAARVYSSGWDALTFAGELRKTGQMFRNLAQSFYNLVWRLPKSAVTGKGRELLPLRALMNIPLSKWLELRYGWRTLVYDMQDLADVIKHLDDGRKRYKERAGSSDSAVTITNLNYTLSVGTSHLVITDRKKSGYRGSIIADIEPPQFAFNPITTGWELITLSFVVDWFLNVGQWLESLSFLAIERQYYGAVGFHYELERELVCTNCTPASGHTYSWYPYSKWTGSFTARDPASVPLLPLASIQLNAFKVLDLVALALQRLK